MKREKLKKRSVQQFADLAEMGLDDVLVTLWGIGMEHIVSPTAILKGEELVKAQEVLGIVAREEIRTIEYWEKLLSISRAGLKDLLFQYGLSLNRDALKVPRKGVSKLKAEARRRGINPFTGLKSFSQSPQFESIEKKETASPLKWRNIGCEKYPLRLLNEEEVIAIHYELVKDFQRSKDPIFPPGVRDKNLLSSAIFRPHTSNGNTSKYPTVEMSAAALLHSLIQNHAFYNGNKRTALVSTLVMLEKNGFMMTCDEDEIFRLLLLIAQHKLIPIHTNEMADREMLAIAEWLCRCSREIDKSERPISGRRLKQILSTYNCKLERVPGGSKMNISRELVEKHMLGIKRKKLLMTQIHFADDGKDIKKNAISKVRKDLNLDENNGIDSHVFYDQGQGEIADFIIKYSKILKKLAKF